MDIPSPPEVVVRPKLAEWMFRRGLKPKDAVAHLGVKHEQIRRYCLPFGDALRAVPTEKVMGRIVVWTSGEVTPADFYPPALSGRHDVAQEVNEGAAQ